MKKTIEPVGIESIGAIAINKKEDVIVEVAVQVGVNYGTFGLDKIVKFNGKDDPEVIELAGKLRGLIHKKAYAELVDDAEVATE